MTLSMKLIRAAVALSLFAAGSVAHAQRGPAARLVKEIAIGDESMPDGLTRVGTVLVGPGGRVYVEQPQDNVIRMFDSTGKYVKNIGGRGQGPGETGFLFGIGFVADTLWSFDLRARRFAFFAADGHAASKPLITFSVSKSVLSALLGIAIGEGKIQSLDDPVARYIPELRDKPAYDGVTLRHLLAMRSGLRFTTLGNGIWADLRSDEAHFYYTTNLPKRIASMPRDHEPGSRWVYKDVDAEVLGWALSNAVGMPVARYLEAKIWHPIGAEYGATWSLDSRDGQEFVASGLNAAARDLAKFGQLFLNGGKSGDRQIVPAEWVRASASVDSSRDEPEISTWWKMQHHLYWWHPLQPPHGDFYADGSNGERIYVDPATRTVIVQLANESNQDFPFRRIAEYFAGRTYEYPRSIPALLRLAGLHSADSVRSAYATFNAALIAAPERYVITASGMNAVGMLLLDSATTRAASIEVLRLTVEHYPDRVQGYLNLATAYERTDDALRAREVLDRAAARFPNDPEVRRRRVGPLPLPGYL